MYILNIHNIYKLVIKLIEIIIGPNKKEPLFEQIKEQIKDAIHTRQLKEGDVLPSMRKLAKDLNISVITTKRAYEELEQEGYVVSTVGKGTFVGQINHELLNEWQRRELENELEKLTKMSKKIGLSRQDIYELIDIYYEEEE